MTKREYERHTGRTQSSDIIGYQFRQAFHPEENITPEEAHTIGVEFATRLLGNEFAFIVATHTDKAHIHNHIIWNSTSRDATHKYRNEKGSFKRLAALSDRICVEHGKSVLQPVKAGNTKSYDRWLGARYKPSHRELVCSHIDRAMGGSPQSWDELIKLLNAAGVVIKYGKQLAFKCPGYERFVRQDSLGAAYTIEALDAVMAGLKLHKPTRVSIYASMYTYGYAHHSGRGV